MKRSAKTTWAGTAAGLALVTGAFLADPIEWKRGLLQVLAGLALIGFGLFARDDDVSSEGTAAPKSMDLPPPPPPQDTP
jgi:hypothetical protein